MCAEVLSLRLRISFAGFRLQVEEDLDLGAVTALFGPSGGGKSTLLRAIAGFEAPQSGRIALGGRVWFDSRSGVDWPPHRRPVGMMFQDARLFSHLDVAGNLGYAARRSRNRQVGFDLADIVAALDLEPLMSRRIGSLSGGERQRAALARTLLTHPELLLLDEPLSALDRERKAEILPYLEGLPQRFGIPTIYVSHSIEEIALLADKVLVLSEGRVQAYGSAASILERVDLQPVTGRFEAGALIQARVAGHDRRLSLTRVELDGETLIMPMIERLAPGARIRLRIRARDVALCTQRPVGISIRNVLPAEVEDIVSRPGTAFAEVFLALRSTRIRARLTKAAVEELKLESGMPVFALIKSVSFDRRLL